MSYRPLTKQEAKDMSNPPLIEDGEYPCELIEFSNVDKNHCPLTDSNGDMMTKIKLKIWDKEGRERSIFTNLFWSERNKMSYRTRNFAESFGVLELYEKGHMYTQFNKCMNKLGVCKIYTQKARAKNDGTDDMWPAKNDVRDFIEKEMKAPVKIDDGFSDLVPF
ncbi:MAG TPA: hypothetical protein VKR58_09980 [Aquella sp.]|nr:hypothetical protein [Aquella sp.]